MDHYAGSGYGQIKTDNKQFLPASAIEENNGEM